MIKFINKVDGSVFHAEPNTIQFTVLKNDSNYEIQEDENIQEEPIKNKAEVPEVIEEEKPTKKKAAK